MEDIRKDIVLFKEIFDPILLSILEREVAAAAHVSDELGWLLSTMKTNALAGGKRLRPYLFYQSVKGLMDNKDVRLTDEEIIRISVFTELVHLELLVLDDIMDKSATRHGVPAVHIQEEKKYAFEFGNKNAEHFGVSAGILSGVIFGNIAFKVLAQSLKDLHPRQAAEIAEYYHNVIIETSYGQFHDLFLSSEKMITEERVALIQLYKTAKYTIEAPLYAGALLVSASQDELTSISRMAIPLGKAFQIVDDIIGIFGDDERTGKSSTSDLEEEKQTLLTVKAYESADQQTKKELLHLLSGGVVHQEHFDRFKEIIVHTGSKQYSNDMADHYLKESLQNLTLSAYNESAKEKFSTLASFIVKRDY